MADYENPKAKYKPYGRFVYSIIESGFPALIFFTAADQRHVICALKVIFGSRANLVAENLALRQQLAVLQRNTTQLKLRNSDRIFWAWLFRLWKGWRSVLLIVQPETVVKWHRQGFKLYWRFKSRKKPGRPKISSEIRKLIRQMSQDNPTWGVPRIKSELVLLGYEVAESTVAKYMYRQKKPPSQTWKTIILPKNWARD